MGQQPQREAHHPGGMAAHPLDRQVGLAGVGRAKHGAHALIGGETGAGGKGHDAQACVRLGGVGQGHARGTVRPRHNTLSHQQRGWSLVNIAFTLLWQENATRRLSWGAPTG